MIRLSYSQIVNGFRYGFSDLPYYCPWGDSRRVASSDLVRCKREIMEKLCKIIEKACAPVVVLHSGGVDSTMILLAAMNCYFARDITVASVGYVGDDRDYDESGISCDMAHRLGLKKHDICFVDGNCVDSVLEKITGRTYSRWFYSSSLIPTYMGYSHFNEIPK